jgi:hypothetical protein
MNIREADDPAKSRDLLLCLHDQYLIPPLQFSTISAHLPLSRSI